MICRCCPKNEAFSAARNICRAAGTRGRLRYRVRVSGSLCRQGWGRRQSVADVGKFGLGAIAAEVEAGVVVVVFIGADHGVGQFFYGEVGIHFAFEAHRVRASRRLRRIFL